MTTIGFIGLGTIPIVTVGHGTAYGIVGRNSARADGMREALRVCIDMARARQRG